MQTLKVIIDRCDGDSAIRGVAVGVQAAQTGNLPSCGKRLSPTG